jgi:YbgC/YbaW family acyl-CoA thioester hydrolase
MINNKPSFYNLEVQFEEIDQGGVVHHPHYLTYMERARNFHMKKAGYSLKEMMKTNFVFAVAQSDISYKLPCKLQDELIVVSFITKLKSASLKITQLIFNGVEASGLESLTPEQLLVAPGVAVTAQLRLACLNLEKFTPMKIPAKITEILS